MDRITIGEAVEELRSQIAEAQAARPDDGLFFEILEAELQIHGTFSRTTDVRGGGAVKFSVFGLGAEATGNASHNRGQTTTHTVKLRLNLRDSKGKGPVEINIETSGKF